MARDGRSQRDDRPLRIIDIGTGTALIPIELCKPASGYSVLAIDISEAMLDVARANVARANLQDRVSIERVEGKGTPFNDGTFGCAISNSAVHHIPEPMSLLAEMWRVTARGGILFVRDLHRPSSLAEVDHLVATYAGTAPVDASLVPFFERQRDLLRASLCASMTVP